MPLSLCEAFSCQNRQDLRVKTRVLAKKTIKNIIYSIYMIFFYFWKSLNLLNFSIFKKLTLKAKHTLKVNFSDLIFWAFLDAFKNLILLYFLDSKLCYNFDRRLALWIQTFKENVSVMPIMVVSMYSEFLTLVVLLLIIRELKK